MYRGFSYRRSMTAVPISIRLVRAAMADSNGNGDASCRSKWCTRTNAPSMPSCSAACASSMVCSSASNADRVASREPPASDRTTGTRSSSWPSQRQPDCAHSVTVPGRPAGVAGAAGAAGVTRAAGTPVVLGQCGPPDLAVLLPGGTQLIIGGVLQDEQRVVGLRQRPQYFCTSFPLGGRLMPGPGWCP